MPASALPTNYGKLREERLGVMLHYDASASDAGAQEWLLRDSRCLVSYQLLILDDGTPINVAPVESRAWHAGVCRPSSAQLSYVDANSAFYGIAIAAKAGDVVRAAQLEAVVSAVRRLFEKHRWPRTDAWRVVGHDTEAWKRGRKHDPTGPDPEHPVLSVARVRELLTQ